MGNSNSTSQDNNNDNTTTTNGKNLHDNVVGITVITTNGGHKDQQQQQQQQLSEQENKWKDNNEELYDTNHPVVVQDDSLEKDGTTSGLSSGSSSGRVHNSQHPPIITAKTLFLCEVHTDDDNNNNITTINDDFNNNDYEDDDDDDDECDDNDYEDNNNDPNDTNALELSPTMHSIGSGTIPLSTTTNTAAAAVGASRNKTPETAIKQPSTTAVTTTTTSSPQEAVPGTTPSGGDSSNSQQPQQQPQNQNQNHPKLYKSSRMKGYITLIFGSFINYDAARKSHRVLGNEIIVPSLQEQRRYAMAVAVVTLLITVTLVIIHLDTFTPFAQSLWYPTFQNGSKIEFIIILFLIIWWTTAVFIQTTVTGIAGDGKGQYSLYYSSWACCLTCYWVLERWWVSAGYSSLKSFIASWPNRSPAWILIMCLSSSTMIWYVDLRHNYADLDRNDERFVRKYFDDIGDGQWQLLLSVTSFTIIPSVVFVFIELFRDSNDDGSIQSKTKLEIIIEGVCFLVLTLMWIPTVIIATTPGGAASLIGNAYFFTWLLVVFLFEGIVWFIHDVRQEQHNALEHYAVTYRKRQQKILQRTLAIQRRQQQLDHTITDDDNNNNNTSSRNNIPGTSNNRLTTNPNLVEFNDDPNFLRPYTENTGVVMQQRDYRLHSHEYY